MRKEDNSPQGKIVTELLQVNRHSCQLLPFLKITLITLYPI